MAWKEPQQMERESKLESWRWSPHVTQGEGVGEAGRGCDALRAPEGFTRRKSRAETPFQKGGNEAATEVS